MNRRHLISAAAATTLAVPSIIWAQADRPIRLIVPFPAGGPTDLLARIVAEPLSRLLGQPIVVDNKGGAGGSLGTAELARALPDGLTFGIASVSTHGVNPAVYKKLPYDPIKDFAPVTEIVKAPVTLVVHPSLGLSSMGAFISHLKKSPGKVTYGSPGNGTTGHMLAELFKSATNTHMLHIPYRGTGPAMVDLLGGQIHAYFDQVASSIPHINSGKLIALAVSWPQRLEILPGVPTFAEVSLFANNNSSWFGLLAPARTSEATIRRIHQAVVSAIAEPGVRARFAQLGLFATGSTPMEFADIIQKEIKVMSRVAKFANIRLD